ncbi:MAG: NAD+ synthase [candidate division NC10 bacterium]|nr:NAD+ synthase [candidate division NC10 bacterium]
MKPTRPDLTINCPLLRKILVGFIENEVHKMGFQRAVIGISGGVDSALSAFLAAEALGASNVWGLILPYKTSSPQSIAHAQLVVEKLQIHSALIDITPMIDAYFALFPEADPLRRGNKMARERMTILYDHSGALSALVLGTSNKTELMLGYGTLYGDMASAINPLGDLFKTQVRQLAAYMGVPEEIVKKEPSADLWVGQTDEGELGFTYEEVDQVLLLMIDKRYEIPDLVEAGFEEKFVRRVFERVQSSQFKRRLPLIAKVSGRTIDRDFRYPRDWGR